MRYCRASSSSRWRSSTSVLPASTTTAAAWFFFRFSIVPGPIVGTSKRMSWFGLATLTSVQPPCGHSSPARSISLSVPSIASTAMISRSFTATAWPMSSAAICLASGQANWASSRTRGGGSKGVSTPASASASGQYFVESTNVRPRRCNSSATALSSVSFRLSRARKYHTRMLVQSGRYRNHWRHRGPANIRALRTRPAMITSRHPARRKARIHRPSCAMPRQQKLSASSRSSGSAQPRSATTATRRPAARAPRATSLGNSPSPAISPSGWLTTACLSMLARVHRLVGPHKLVWVQNRTGRRQAQASSYGLPGRRAGSLPAKVCGSVALVHPVRPPAATR